MSFDAVMSMAIEPGGKHRASEIPNNNRELTVEIIRE
jgi:antitoxin component HigA of HigAB toxin-antitoxin module